MQVVIHNLAGILHIVPTVGNQQYKLVFCIAHHWYFVQAIVIIITIMACQKSPTATDSHSKSNSGLNWWLGFNENVLFIYF